MILTNQGRSTCDDSAGGDVGFAWRGGEELEGYTPVLQAGCQPETIDQEPAWRRATARQSCYWGLSGPRIAEKAFSGLYGQEGSRMPENALSGLYRPF